jgi:hypothetical protein
MLCSKSKPTWTRHTFFLEEALALELEPNLELEPKAVLLAEAAARLGVGVEALRQRITKGSARGFKRGGKWYIVLEEDPTPTPMQGPIRAPIPPSPSPTPRVSRTPRPPQRTDRGEQVALVAALREEVSFLRRQLERQQEDLSRRDEALQRQLDQAEAERAEMRRLLAAALSRVPELPQAVATDQGAVDEAEMLAPRSWWRRLAFWRSE